MSEIVMDTSLCSEALSVSHYRSALGVDEYFMVLRVAYHTTFAKQLTQLAHSYEQGCAQVGIDTDSVVFSRIYSSDTANQDPAIRASSLYKKLSAGAISIVGQTPAFCGSCAVLTYHCARDGKAVDRSAVHEDGENGLQSRLVHGEHYSMLWNGNYRIGQPFDSAVQTKWIFDKLDENLTSHAMTFLDSAVRSWVYVRDVDNHYAGMVEQRKSFFSSVGLDEKSRYLASTGIEGGNSLVSSLVLVDMLSYGGLEPGQIERMDVLSHMPRTIDYGVTFERALRVRFGDRSHIYLSGTASIDEKGVVLHLGDIVAQTRRTIENIKALFATQGASLADLAYLLVYMRDIKAVEAIQAELRKEVPETVPVLYLQGPVCRPTWLVEIEGVAIIAEENEFKPFL
jgi:enamine deaminase RidA (YjgF/YER057c/UK114 family)